MSRDQSLLHALLPVEPSLGNFQIIFNNFPIAHWIFLSFAVSILCVIGGVLTSFFPAYALSRFQWRGRGFVLAMIVISIMIPSQVVLIPLYSKFVQLGWVPSLKPLIVPYFLSDPLTIFVLRQFLLNIPENISNAARIDGATEIGVMFKIIMPICAPAIYAVSFLIFLESWSDLYAPLLYTVTDENLWTLPLGIVSIAGLHNVNPNLTMAASALFMLPVIILFFLTQKYVISIITPQDL